METDDRSWGPFSKELVYVQISCHCLVMSGHESTTSSFSWTSLEPSLGSHLNFPWCCGCTFQVPRLTVLTQAWEARCIAYFLLLPWCHSSLNLGRERGTSFLSLFQAVPGSYPQRGPVSLGIGSYGVHDGDRLRRQFP